MRLRHVLGIVVAAALAYLLLWPVPITPTAWAPPPVPSASEGPFAYNERLQAAQVLARGAGNGPEGLALDAAGRVYSGYLDGRIFRLAPDGQNIELLANTGGRPLGLAFAGDRLIVADAVKGLLALEPDGRLTTLSTGSGGVPFRFVDDVDVAADGRIYFSDASSRFGPAELMADFFEHGGNGRLLRYDPATGQTETLLDGLYFANGIALGPDDAYVLVNETGRYQITRYWLSGDKAGTHDLFIANLPGFPDNVSFNGSDTFWLALYAPRTPDLDWLLQRPFLRKVVYRLPAFLHPAPVMHGWVVGLDLNGQVVANAQYLGEGAFAPITSVKQHGDTLYLGSLAYPGLARVPVAAVKP